MSSQDQSGLLVFTLLPLPADDLPVPQPHSSVLLLERAGSCNQTPGVPPPTLSPTYLLAPSQAQVITEAVAKMRARHQEQEQQQQDSGRATVAGRGGGEGLMPGSAAAMLLAATGQDSSSRGRKTDASQIWEGVIGHLQV